MIDYIQNTWYDILKGLIKIQFEGSRAGSLIRALIIAKDQDLITRTHMVTHRHP